MSDWCILRCSGRSTLDLAKSLTEDKFEVWTPVETRYRLAGRKREVIEQDIPILPEYVFARIVHLSDLLALSRTSSLSYREWNSKLRRMVLKYYPKFSVFHRQGQFYPQPEKNLAPLRALEENLQKLANRRREQALQVGEPPKFKAGQVVRVDSGGFVGLSLTVAEDSHGKDVKLIHPDWMWTVEISAWKLKEFQVRQASPEQATVLAA